MGTSRVFMPFFLLCVAVIPREAKAELNPIAKTTNYLGVEIHKKLSVEGGNLFFSPVSVSTALGMLFYGARGHTAQNMRSVLGFQNASLTDDEVHAAYKNLVETFNEEPAEDYHLFMANAALIQKDYPILPSYKTGIQNTYQAIVKEVDSADKAAVAREINEWVKEKTNNQIKRFIKRKQLDPRNPLILLNAVYFKGAWEKEFKSTSSGLFLNRGLESEKTSVPMMALDEWLRYAHIEEKHLQFVEMPYKGEHVSMVILLPDAVDGLAELERNLTPDTFRDMRRRTSETRVILSFPKFRLKFKKEMKTVLRGLGVDVFDDDADFSGITTQEQLEVSKVLHQASIRVNEKGTVAAAVTSLLLVPMSIAETVTADHPFLFAIIDVRSDLILFIGRVDEL